MHRSINTFEQIRTAKKLNIYLVQEQYLCCGRTEQLRSECEQHGSLGNIIHAGILRAAGGGGGEEVVMFA